MWGTIFASGGIEEEMLAAFAREQAPIDGIGIGTSLTTSSDAPALDCANKLQEYAGLPRRNLSARRLGQAASRCSGVMEQKIGWPVTSYRLRMMTNPARGCCNR
jgi:nicotinic acid phosphoribosyltransferase